MPEFILDKGSAEHAKAFDSLDSFTQGYIEAMFFTNASGRPDDGELEHATFADLAPSTLEKIIADCAWFQKQHANLLNETYEKDDYEPVQAGRDFWYTRNHHGVGFWDRNLYSRGEQLTRYAHTWRELTLYLGDDELVYVE
jgi:hypothetical protein